MSIVIADAWEEPLRRLAQQRGVTEQQVVEEALRWYFSALKGQFTPQERAEFETWERASDEDFANLGQEHDWPWQP